MSNIKRFFTDPVSKNTLGFFRMATGAFAFVQLLVLLPDWMWFYGPDGIMSWEISDSLSTRSTPGMHTIFSLFPNIGISMQTFTYSVTFTYFVSLLALILGYKTRIAAILAWLTHLMLNTTGHFTAYGVETFLHIALFYCMVLPVGISKSLDQYLNPGTVAPYLITLSVRIIQLHLAIMYMASGLEKAMGSQWWNGEAIWIALQQDQFHKYNTDWMANMPVVPKVLGWGTLVVETFYPVGIFWRKTRSFWLLGILSMHLFIALFLGLTLFGGLMFLLNLSVFTQSCWRGYSLKSFSIFRTISMAAKSKRQTAITLFKADFL